MRGFFESSLVQSERPDKGLIPRCGACGLYQQGCKSPKMKPHGRGSLKVLVVGEAPGETEDKYGRPFVGKAGEFLRQVLRRIDIDLDKHAVTTNALICRPPDNKIADPRMIDYCRPNLTRTIQKMNPTVIITLGRSALASVLDPYCGKGQVGTLEGWVGWQIPLAQHWVCPTWHPSYLLRVKNSMMDQRFEEHLKAAFELDEKPKNVESYPSRIQLLYEDKKVCEAIDEHIEIGGWGAIDFETNCLKPELPRARIHSCAISNGKSTFAFPFTGRAKEATLHYIQSPNIRKIASNLKFEDRWARFHLGEPVTNWGWDTMLAAHCLDNRPEITSLKFQAFVRLGVAEYNANVEPYLRSHKGPYNRIDEIALETCLTYNGMDAILEYDVAMHQRKEMGYED